MSEQFPCARVKNLRVDFPNVCAVNDVSFELFAGEAFGLVGPNGAGKTTTMHAMLGLIDPSLGEIEILGEDIFQNHEVMKDVGFMPDFPPLYEDLLVWEFLDLFAASYGIKKAERSQLIEEHMCLLKIEEKRNEYIKGLSRGMRQRVMLAKTFIPDPKILILDEPSSGLDPNGRELLSQILEQKLKENKAIMISSHILSDLSGLCKKIGLMEKGKMLIQGDVAELSKTYLKTVKISISTESLEAKLTETISKIENVKYLGKHTDGTYLIEISSEPKVRSEILNRLVQEGIEVSSFNAIRDNLPEVFFALSKDEVS